MKRKLILILIFFLIAEVATRILTHFITIFDIEMAKYALALKIDSPVKLIGHIHRPGSSARLMGVNIRINSDGQRGRDYPVIKENGVYRIILLGDSLTLGWGVDEDKTFGRILENKLSLVHKVEVLNFSVGNYNTEQEVNLFFERGIKYNPNEVLLCYFINDAEKMQARSKLWFLVHSRFITLLWSRALALWSRVYSSANFSQYYAKLYEDGQSGWLHAQASIIALSKYCLNYNIRFRVIILPEFHNLAQFPFKKEYQKLEGVLVKHGISYLNMCQFFQGFHDPYQFWVATDDAHPNAKANRVIADYLYEYVKGDMR